MRSASHVLDSSDRKALAYGILEQVLGPLRWLSEEVAQGAYQGQPVWIERGYVQGRHERLFYLSVPTNRPVDFRLLLRKNSLGVTNQVISGDSVFDSIFIVSGGPPEVLQAALDPTLRSWILARWPNEEPSLHLGSDNCLKLSFHMPSSHELQTGQARSLLPEDIAACTQFLQRLGLRLTESFDAIYATIARTQGQSSAVAWAQSLAAARQSENDRQARIRQLFIFGPIAFVVIVLLFVMAVVGAVLLFG